MTLKAQHLLRSGMWPTTFDLGAGPALVLDHGSAVFIYLGTLAARGSWSPEALASAAQGFVQGLAEGRLPMPEVRTIAEVRLICLGARNLLDTS